jgi:signal transduction histidine kinase
MTTGEPQAGVQPAQREAATPQTGGRRRAWRSKRVGFWPALIEITLVSNLLALVFLIPLVQQLPAAIQDLLGFLSLGIFIWPAYRLAPGTGDLPRRVMRLSAWVLLFALINGPIAWLMITYLPFKSDFMGISVAEMELTPGLYALTYLFTLLTFFLPTRLLLSIWQLGSTRLRWRLTFSYLALGLTSVIFLPLAMVLFLALVSISTLPPLFTPAILGEQLARDLGPTLERNPAPEELQQLLNGLLAGTIRLPFVPPENADTPTANANDYTLDGVRRLTLLHPDGTILASAGENPLRTGAFLGGEGEEIRLIIEQSIAYGSCVEGRPVTGPLADTAACSVQDSTGRTVAILAVESNLDTTSQVGAAFGRVVRVSLVGATILFNLVLFLVLLLAPVGLGVGYLLARGVTRRLERLTTAAGSIAAGDLAARIPIDSTDEIGRLSENFNTMAEQLAERERALAAAAARSEELLRANQRLVADVSHELRNPLATLRGYLEALEQDHGAKLPAHDMHVIRSEIQRLTGMVDELFTLARAEARKLPLEFKVVDAGALIERLVGTLAPLAQREREITLLSRTPPDPPHVAADPMRLEQVLRNLVQNALRYTPPGGIIVLEAEPAAGGMVRISVADTGVGIAAEDLGQIFDRFYRGDSSRARETGGAGLGLALVQELVRAMGGDVGVESTPGRGSRFMITLQQAE